TITFTALSLLQNGKLQRLLSSELVEEVFSEKENCKQFILDSRKGLDALGVYTLASKLPTLVHVFTPGASTPLSVKKLTNILSPILSDNGSNKRRLEAAVYAKFVKYIREVASGHRGDVTLNSILQFVTGADEEPILGYQIKPTIHFAYAGVSFSQHQTPV
ncbi:uncharacterized protein LOC110463717, partial [Mizuhopecten yessoensis]|uniref:uncharacterized protein LOC110463717 n=1 Tax=Mizuhopecten yessoensis TaxID=6573 RepID=UPI000B45ED3D